MLTAVLLKQKVCQPETDSVPADFHLLSDCSDHLRFTTVIDKITTFVQMQNDGVKL